MPNHAELDHNYGSLTLKRFRKIYGVRFGRGHSDFTQLSTVLPSLDEVWLRQLVRDDDSGDLRNRLGLAAKP